MVSDDSPVASRRTRRVLSSSDEDDDTSLFDENLKTPYLKKTGKLTLKEIISIFGDIIFNTKSFPRCTEVPYRCSHEAAFLIDMDSVACHKDVTSDGLGTYVNNSCDRYWFKNSKGQLIRCSSKKFDYEVKSTHFNLKRDKSFKRRIIELTKSAAKAPIFTILCYSFKGASHPLPPMQPHGNSKCDRAYTSTKQSVRTKITEKKGKVTDQVIHDSLFQEAGGVLKVKNDTDYPRNMRQIYTAKSNQQSATSKDDIFDIISKKADPNSYVLDVHCGQNCHIAITLASPYQLEMLESMCCSKNPVILGIDMTYNCGEKYYITPTVIQHPLLLHTQTMVEPTILGPTIIHTEHNENVYRKFASDLVNARPGLRGVKLLGSDRQHEIYNGFKVQMPDLKLLLCKRHVEENVTSFLEKRNIAQAAKTDILDDIFKDLINCSSESEFVKELYQIKCRWDETDPNIFTWFNRYQSTSFKESLIKCHRDAAGLQGKHFYNNACESMNRLMKTNVSRKTNLCAIVDEWVGLVNSQENHLHRSLIN